MSFIYFFSKKKFLEKSLRGTPAIKILKKLFNPNMLIHISIDAVFDEDYENHRHFFIGLKKFRK